MTFVSRAEWGASNPADCPAFDLVLPVSAVYVHHTATGAPTGVEARDLVRQIQRWHVDGNGWQDIGYCWIVDQAGDVYAGREWRVGAHTYGQNSTSVGIAWLGNSNELTPSPAALDAIAGLVRGGRAIGAITPEFTLQGHRDAPENPTECPGDLLEAALPTIRQMIDGGPVTPTEQLVRDLYRTYCLREGDPEGVAYWTGLLDAGAIDRQSLAVRMIVDEGWTALTRRTEP